MQAGDHAGVAQEFESLGTETGKEMAQCVLEKGLQRSTECQMDSRWHGHFVL